MLIDEKILQNSTFLINVLSKIGRDKLIIAAALYEKKDVREYYPLTTHTLVMIVIKGICEGKL